MRSYEALLTLQYVLFEGNLKRLSVPSSDRASAEQHGHEGLAPVHVAAHHHGRLGHLHHPHGHRSGPCPRLARPLIAQNFAGLFATRVFLGITEAGLFPGVTFFSAAALLVRNL